jgi:hypothetical protein
LDSMCKSFQDLLEHNVQTFAAATEPGVLQIRAQ